jgi:hypothetical protein
MWRLFSSLNFFQNYSKKIVNWYGEVAVAAWQWLGGSDAYRWKEGVETKRMVVE